MYFQKLLKLSESLLALVFGLSGTKIKDIKYRPSLWTKCTDLTIFANHYLMFRSIIRNSFTTAMFRKIKDCRSSKSLTPESTKTITKDIKTINQTEISSITNENFSTNLILINRFKNLISIKSELSIFFFCTNLNKF
jgi:hypothetical protein